MRTSILVGLTLAGIAVAGITARADAAAVALTDAGAPVAALVVPAGHETGTVAEQGAELSLIRTGIDRTESIERQSAELIREFVERMSGATLPIVGADDVPSDAEHLVIVGDAELAAARGVDASELGPGGIRLKTVGSDLVLLGGPERVAGESGRDAAGLRYAAIELLEQLGVRYLWPGESGLVVPERAGVVVPELDITYTPQIRSRYFRRINRPRVMDWRRARVGMERLEMELEQWQRGYERAMGDVPEIRWGNWQRLGGRMQRFGHAGAGLRDGEQFKETNPEWFAKQADGTRSQDGQSRWRLCKSNPELIEHVANDIIARRNENPDLTLVSLDPNDGSGRTGWCQCEDCKALDPEDAPTVQMLIFPTTENRAGNRQRVDHPSLTDRMVFYWNSIAERVTEEHPDLLFGVSAYSRFSDPPVERDLHPNLIVRYVPSDPDGWAGWHERGARRMFWRPNILLRGRGHGKLLSYVGRLAESMRYLADAGLMQTDFDANTHYWSVAGLNYYAAARLNWNPRLTADEIIRDFAEHGFGEGADDIERYFRHIERVTESDDDYTFDDIAELCDRLDAAERAVGDDETIRERIAFLRVGLSFTDLQVTLGDKSRRAGAGERINEELARRLIDLNALVLRDIMLNHNQAIHTALLAQVSSTFSQFRQIGGRTVTPSDPALLEKLADPRFGLTGREDSVEAMLRAFGLAQVSVVPYHDAGDWLEPAAFTDYRVVVVPRIRRSEHLRAWTEAEVAALRDWVADGGTLIFTFSSVYRLAGHSRNLSRLAPLLGATRYIDPADTGAVLAPDHPLVARLDEREAWFTRGRALGQLTTATPLVGTFEVGVVLVNEVGQGQVVFIGSEIGTLSEDAGRAALGAVFRAAFERAGVEPVDAEVAELEALTAQVALFGAGRGRQSIDWLIENVLIDW